MERLGALEDDAEMGGAGELVEIFDLCGAGVVDEGEVVGGGGDAGGGGVFGEGDFGVDGDEDDFGGVVVLHAALAGGGGEGEIDEDEAGVFELVSESSSVPVSSWISVSFSFRRRTGRGRRLRRGW